MTAIELESVAFSYRGRPALRGVSFSIEPGAMAALLGPNGCGKTTLFRILCTILKADSGSAKIFGLPVEKDSHLVRSQIGVVFQSPSLDLELSIEENLTHQGYLYGLHGQPLERRIRELLERFALTDRRRERVKKLSGGLQRRADLAKAMLHQPRLLLLDEPTSGLDPRASREFWDDLGRLKEQNDVTLLLTTHTLEEAERCDYLVIMAEGRVVSSGTPEDLKKRVGSEVVVIRTRESEKLASRIEEELGYHAMSIDGQVRLEHEDGHHLVTDLVHRYGNWIDAITVSRPTLEDVFIHETGRPFDSPE